IAQLGHEPRISECLNQVWAGELQQATVSLREIRATPIERDPDDHRWRSGKNARHLVLDSHAPIELVVEAEAVELRPREEVRDFQYPIVVRPGVVAEERAFRDMAVGGCRTVAEVEGISGLGQPGDLV